MHDWELANTVTAYCTCLAGVIPLALCWAMSPQPRRWWAVWWCVFATGIFTVWYHGFGEGPVLRAFDTGSNLVVVVALLNAVLLDFYAAWHRRVLGAAVAVNAAALVLMFGSQAAIDPQQTLVFGGYGGYHLGEIVLIADALLATGLMAAARDRVPQGARRALGIAIVCFLVGAGLSTANSELIVWRIVPMHATWHVVGAFGFIALWAAQHARLHPAEGT